MDGNADFDGPLLSPGDKHPGGWRLDEISGLSTWQGEMHWRTRHGEATVHWLFARPHRVVGAHLLDGTRLDRVETRSPMNHDAWRRPDGKGGYLPGVIEISEFGVLFRDGPKPVYEPGPLPSEGEDPDLEAELLRDRDFLKLVQQDGFAFAAYHAFQNRDFRKKGSDGRWSCSFRRAGTLVAEARQKGESYVNFYPWGGDYTQKDTDAFYSILAALGWAEMTPAEIARDHEKAMALLRDVEARPEGERAAWAERMGANDRLDAIGRMSRAAAAGKCTEAEWRTFCFRYESNLDTVAAQETQDILAQALGDDSTPGRSLN